MSSSHGWIRLRGLRIEGVRLGIYPHERDAPRAIVVDLGLWVPIRPAARSERIEDTIDYDRVAALTRELSCARYFPLLESLCETVAAGLLERLPSAERVQLEITKPDVPATGGVSILIERSR